MHASNRGCGKADGPSTTAPDESSNLEPCHGQTTVSPSSFLSRSDERIKEDISEEMTRDENLDASEIELQVQGGEVTLSGVVTSRQAKRMAEDLAECVSGVNAVHNQLRVKPQSTDGGRSDRESQGTRTGESEARNRR